MLFPARSNAIPSSMSEQEAIELDSEHSDATIDHETIRRWVEERGGQPAHVEATADDGAGILRLQFPDTKRDHDEIEPISWDDFFEKFEEEGLAFVYQEETENDRMSRFYKFVDRESVQ